MVISELAGCQEGTPGRGGDDEWMLNPAEDNTTRHIQGARGSVIPRITEQRLIIRIPIIQAPPILAFVLTRESPYSGVDSPLSSSPHGG